MDEKQIRSEIKRLTSLLASAKGSNNKTTAVRVTHDGSVEKVSTREMRKMLNKRGGRRLTIIVNRSRSVN